ncbi:MAG: Maf family protein [Monoglobales bacterium]
MDKEIILASASPRRKEILQNLGVKFRIVTSDAEEITDDGLPPNLIVQQLAMLKGTDVAKKVKNVLVISADTIVWDDGEVLGKPENIENAKEMLKKLSGKTHEVYTGVCVTDSKSGKSISDFEVTKVKFRNLSKEEIDRYVNTYEPMDKAGAYGIQGKGCLLVESIKGDYLNVVGLPAVKLAKILKEEFNFNIM